MRLVMSGATQSIYSIIIAADPRWPHVNGDQCQIYFPEQSIEAGNAGASMKIGGAGLTTDTTDVNDILTEGDRKFLPSQGGGGMNKQSLKTTYVRGSAASTVFFLEHHIG